MCHLGRRRQTKQLSCFGHSFLVQKPSCFGQAFACRNHLGLDKLFSVETLVSTRSARSARPTGFLAVIEDGGKDGGGLLFLPCYLGKESGRI